MWKWLTKRRSSSGVPAGRCCELVDAWVRSGQVDMLKQALKLGLRPSAIVDETLGTVLHVACAHDLFNALVVLHAHQAVDNVTNSAGEYAIHVAATKGHKDCAQYLLKNMKVELDQQDAEGFTPVMRAVQHDRRETVQMLVLRGADVLDARSRLGFGAVHLCNSGAMLRVLISSTAVKIDDPDRNGRSIFMLATVRHHHGVVQEALHAGASLSKQDVFGQNAMHLAIVNRRTGLVPSLVHAGVSTIAVDKEGFTPIERALLMHDAESAYALYCAGALFTKRQLLLLGILLERCSMFEEACSTTESESGAAASPPEPPAPASVDDLHSMSNLTVSCGAVPMVSMTVAELSEAFAKFQDPIARPPGCDAARLLLVDYLALLEENNRSVQVDTSLVREMTRHQDAAGPDDAVQHPVPRRSASAPPGGKQIVLDSLLSSHPTTVTSLQPAEAGSGRRGEIDEVAAIQFSSFWDRGKTQPSVSMSPSMDGRARSPRRSSNTRRSKTVELGCPRPRKNPWARDGDCLWDTGSPNASERLDDVNRRQQPPQDAAAAPAVDADDDPGTIVEFEDMMARRAMLLQHRTVDRN